MAKPTLSYMEYDAQKALIIENYTNYYEDMWQHAFKDEEQARERMQEQIKAEIDALCAEFEIEEPPYTLYKLH